ncbi:hypothetical protein PQG02_32405 (plasmid) [Nostoc sp. UHCC 0926]|nr:hypothetical protein PQG02_32405 [Nostoc sp. UHCC 0926]
MATPVRLRPSHLTRSLSLLFETLCEHSSSKNYARRTLHLLKHLLKILTPHQSLS